MKQISTLVYVFIDDGVYVGRGANIVLSDTKILSFRAPIAIFHQRLAQELDDYSFETPLTQQELDRISLPSVKMIKSKIIMLETKVYVEDNVMVRHSFAEELKNG